MLTLGFWLTLRGHSLLMIKSSGRPAIFKLKTLFGHKILFQARRKKPNYGGGEIRFIYITQQITWWFLTSVEFNNRFLSYSSEEGGSIPYLAFRYANYLTLKVIWRNFFIKNFFYGGRPPRPTPLYTALLFYEIQKFWILPARTYQIPCPIRSFFVFVGLNLKQLDTFAQRWKEGFTSFQALYVVI